MQVVSLNHTREERGLLGKPSRVGAGEISAGKAPRERRGGHACKIAKWKVKYLENAFTSEVNSYLDETGYL